MMKQPIAFVAGIDQAETDLWLALFREVMPEEEVVIFDALPDLTQVEVAIAANPKPDDLLKLPNLKWIQSLWAGVEGILKEKSLDHIPLARMTDPNLAATMAEAVLAWTLYLHRDMPKYAEQQKVRLWKQQPFVRAEERTVGILGLGKLGLKAAEKLRAADFNVVGWSRSLKEIEGVQTFTGDNGLHDMLAQSDIIVNLLPHTPATWNLLNTDTFAQMKPRASLINFGRGATVEPNSLMAALDSGHLKHAVLDVFKKEPLPDDNALWAHPKITILPHISAPTDPKTASQLVARNILTYRSSKVIPTVVNRELGY